MFINKILNAKAMKPYGKLSELIDYAVDNSLISNIEAFKFREELTLLLEGKNESANIIPRKVVF